MKNFKRLNLQFFADGGGAGAGAGTGGESGTGGTTEGATAGAIEDSMEMRIPERAKDAWKKAVEKTNPKPQQTAGAQQTIPTKEEPKPEHIPYEALIKGDEYKDEHKAYMEKTINDRVKGLNQKLLKMQGALGKVGLRYGLDSNSESYIDDVIAKVDEDNEFYEAYAMEHDIPVSEAKKSIEMEQKVRFLEKQAEMQAAQEQDRQIIETLKTNAAKTKLRYPSFDLETEMANETFRRMCAVTGGDTTAAYVAIHHGEIIPAMVTAETQKAKVAMTNSIASGQARPLEGGLMQKTESNVPPQPSFKGMTAAEMKEYAYQHMRR